jgi:hypothetical protein
MVGSTLELVELDVLLGLLGVLLGALVVDGRRGVDIFRLEGVLEGSGSDVGLGVETRGLDGLFEGVGVDTLGVDSFGVEIFGVDILGGERVGVDFADCWLIFDPGV